MTIYTIDQVAERMQVHRSTVQDWIQRGLLDCARLNDSRRAPVRITQQQLDEFLSNRSGYYVERARSARRFQ